MSFWNEFIHEIYPSKCLKHARWDGNILKCCKCGEAIALKFEFVTPSGVQSRIMVLPRFEKKKNFIKLKWGFEEI